MQIIISVMIVGLLWMIYDLINAPELDENENEISANSDTFEESPSKKPAINQPIQSKKEISEVDN